MNKPAYEKKLWDDRGSWFSAPTIRGVVDIGVTIAAKVLTAPMGGVAGALLSAAINLADDAVFTAMDVASGQMSWDAAWGGFAKKAVISGATSFAGAAGFGSDGFVSGFTNSLLGEGVLSSVVNAGLQSLTSKAISSTVNSFNWSQSGLSFDTNAMWSQWDPSNLANYADVLSSMANAGVGGLMNSTGRGFLGEKWKDFQKVGNFAGSLASTAVTYGLTGNAKFNLLNFADFGGRDVKGNEARVGLMEMNFGKDGFSMNLGTGGTDLSLSQMSGVMRGISVWGENARIGAKGYDESITKALRALSSQNQGSKTYGLYDDIMNGRVSLRDDVGLSGQALTTAGTDGRRTITLGKRTDGEFDMAVLLAHEAERNGLADGVEGQRDETNRAVWSHMNMAQMLSGTYGATTLNRDNQSEVELLNAYQSAKTPEEKALAEKALGARMGQYDSSSDYWRLRMDGTKWKMERDGKQDLTVELPDGTTIVVKAKGKLKDGSVSGSNSLGEWFGIGKSGDDGNDEILNRLGWNGTQYTKDFIPTEQDLNNLKNGMLEAAINQYMPTGLKNGSFPI